MRDYGRISPSFWTGTTGRAIRDQGKDAVIVALYLLTAPSSSMIGLYYLPIPTLSHETGIPLQGASKALRSLSTVGFALYDDVSETVFVLEMAAYQIDDELKPNDKRIKGIRREIERFKKTPFYSKFFERYSAPFRLGQPSPIEGASETHRSQDQDQEQEQENLSKGAIAPARVDGNAFLKAWTAAGIPGLPNVSPLVIAINALPTTQRPEGDLAAAFCAAVVKYIAGVLEHKRAKIPADPESLAAPKHFGNIVDVMMGRFDLSKLAQQDRATGGARPVRKFNDGIGAQPVTKEEEL